MKEYQLVYNFLTGECSLKGVGEKLTPNETIFFSNPKEKEVHMKVIKVSKCSECPYKRPYGTYSYYCGRLSTKDIPEEGIPSWCPLENEWEHVEHQLHPVIKEARVDKFKQLFCGRGTGKLWMGFQLQDDGTWKRTDWSSLRDYKSFPEEYYKFTINKEAHMKKAVFILQEATKDGVEGYIVKGWENVLDREELPLQYYLKEPCFLGNENHITICEHYVAHTFTKNTFLSKTEWNWYQHLMLQAGHRLSKILEEQRKPKVIRFEI